MELSDLNFLFRFLPIFLLAYYFCPARHRNRLLFVSSLLFYLFNGWVNTLLLTCSLLCKYFRTAVLPADADLYAEVMGSSHHKRCIVCGRPFPVRSNRAVYCDCCAEVERRRKNRDRVRRHRGTA